MIAKLFGWAWTKLKADANSALMINETGGSFAPIRVYNGGASLPLDTDPNVAGLLPSDARVLQWPTAWAASNQSTFTSALTASVFGPATKAATLRLWVYEAVNGKWLSPINTITRTVGGAQGGSFLVGQNIKPLYLQITANTGVVELYYGIT